MIFNSYTYLIFLLAMFFMYWAMPIRFRNVFLIAGSYFFYCTWNWQFGFLLFALSLFNWAYGRWVLSEGSGAAKLTIGISVNLGVLVFFKYLKFILTNIAVLAHLINVPMETPKFNILLPLGLSFFTFQGIAYLVDIASGDKPLTRLTDFLLFKALWPQLVAGPIIRLHEIREQLAPTRTILFEDVTAGLQRILLGLFKKVVLADTLGPFVDSVFASSVAPSFVDSIVGIFGFGLQIYFDFSGYSDIAIGSARLFGFKFPENFNWPYAASSPQEFWNRWHMSLSRWIRDYVYSPLSFKFRYQPSMHQVSLLAAMAICGLWHGAQWTFVLWGVWHGLLLVGQQTIFKNFFSAKSEMGRLIATATTFLLVNLGWLLFRAQSLGQVGDFLVSMATFKGGLRPFILRESIVALVVIFTACFVAIQLFFVPRWTKKPLLPSTQSLWWTWFFKPAWNVFLITFIIIFEQEARTFVYFQF